MAQKHLSSEKDSPMIEIEERDQANNLVATYYGSETTTRGQVERVDVVIPKNSSSFARSILNAFLPVGYPQSVTEDYLEYQIYDSLQAFSSSIAGLLSSRAVLEGIGVGDSKASPTAALLLTVLQDSMGRIATILFAHRFGTALEPECKMYRLLADIFNDAAMIFDCLSPALPRASRVLLLSLSSVLRALCGVAAGSSKASLSAHFATMGNLGELNAKDSSQETIISLVGMLVGTFVVSHIHSQSATWTAMITLLAIHLGTNYLAVRAVRMRTLNRQRANLVFSDILAKLPPVRERSMSRKISSVKVMTPQEISLRERIFERDGVLRWNGSGILGYCRIGVSIQQFIGSLASPNPTTGSYKGPAALDFVKAVASLRDSQYVLRYDAARKTCLVLLKESASSRDQLTAWMHALYFTVELKGCKEEEDTNIFMWQTYVGIQRLVDSGLWDALSKAGWDIDVSALETREGRRVAMKKPLR